MNATMIWLLVLLSGTPNTGYNAQIMYRTEKQADCETFKKEWLRAYPGQGNLDARLQCITINQKLVERYPY